MTLGLQRSQGGQSQLNFQRPQGGQSQSNPPRQEEVIEVSSDDEAAVEAPVEAPVEAAVEAAVEAPVESTYEPNYEANYDEEPGRISREERYWFRQNSSSSCDESSSESDTDCFSGNSTATMPQLSDFGIGLNTPPPSNNKAAPAISSSPRVLPTVHESSDSDDPFDDGLDEVLVEAASQHMASQVQASQVQASSTPVGQFQVSPSQASPSQVSPSQVSPSQVSPSSPATRRPLSPSRPNRKRRRVAATLDDDSDDDAMDTDDVMDEVPTETGPTVSPEPGPTVSHEPENIVVSPENAVSPEPEAGPTVSPEPENAVSPESENVVVSPEPEDVSMESPEPPASPVFENSGASPENDIELPDHNNAADVPDYVQVDPVVKLYCHNETGIYVCDHNHDPTVVLHGQLANHKKKRHTGDGEQKIVRDCLSKHITDGGINAVPSFIHTPLPIIPVEERDYCFHCKRVFKHASDHTKKYECKRQQPHKVRCQFYSQNKWVVVGPVPQPVEELPNLRSFLRSHEVLAGKLKYDSPDTHSFTFLVGWTQLLEGETKTSVGHLMAAIDENMDTDDPFTLKQLDLVQRIDRILTWAYDITKERPAVLTSVGGHTRFIVSSTKSTFNTQLSYLKRVVLYMTRTYHDPKYDMSEELKTAFEAMMAALSAPDRQQQQPRPLHQYDDVDKKVLEALYQMVQERSGAHYTTHPWSCAMATWALNERGGFRHHEAYPAVFTHLKKVARYIYVEKAWVDNPKFPNDAMEAMEKKRTKDVIYMLSLFENFHRWKYNPFRVSGEYVWCPERNQVMFRDKFFGFKEFGAAAKVIMDEIERRLVGLFGVASYDDIPAFDLNTCGRDLHTAAGDWLCESSMNDDEQRAVKWLIASGRVVVDATNPAKPYRWAPQAQDNYFQELYALLRLVTMMMYLSQTGVARGNEIIELCWRTTLAGIRSCFIRYRGHLGIHSHAQKSKRFENVGVMRFLPPRASQIFLKVARFCFPIYRNVDGHRGFQPNDGNFYLFPHKKTWAHSCVKQMWSQYLGVPDAGLREFRHIMTLLYPSVNENLARFGDVGDNVDEEEWEGDDIEVAATNDSLAMIRALFGHTKDTANAYYGHTPLPASMVGEYELANRFATAQKLFAVMGFHAAAESAPTPESIEAAKTERVNEMQQCPIDRIFRHQFSTVVEGKVVDPEFRPGQREAMAATCRATTDKSVVLAALPVGSGKTATFAIPASWHRAYTTVVLVPTVALIDDMLVQLDQYRGINAVAYADQKWPRVAHEKNRVVVMAYESAVSPQAMSYMKGLGIHLDRIVIDEVHYIHSVTGGFRPIVVPAMQKMFTLSCPVLLLTGTLALDGRKALLDQLRLKDSQVADTIRAPKSFGNVEYRYEPITKTSVGDAAETVKRLLANVPDHGKVIVFVKTKTRCDNLHQSLLNDPPAHYPNCLKWHSDCTDAKTLDYFRGKGNLIVATSGLGMGVNLGDVRAVIHVDPPYRADAFVQEMGRAGRKGHHAVVTLAAKVDPTKMSADGDEDFFRRYTTGCLRQAIRGHYDDYLAPPCQPHERLCSACSEGNVADTAAIAAAAVRHQEQRAALSRQQLNDISDFVEKRITRVREMVNGECIYCKSRGLTEQGDHPTWKCDNEAWQTYDPSVVHRTLEGMQQYALDRVGKICYCGSPWSRCSGARGEDEVAYCGLKKSVFTYYQAWTRAQGKRLPTMMKLMSPCMPLTDTNEAITFFFMELIRMTCEADGLNFDPSHFVSYD